MAVPTGRRRGAAPRGRAPKAYEEVADRLRERIVDGALERGERLPNETVLAADFGVSRATVREALRVLAAQDLIRTAKGAGGGSYVTLPSLEGITEFVSSSIGLLANAHDVSLDELLEARELLEVPAVRLASQRCSAEALARLRDAIPAGDGLDAEEHFDHNAEFHAGVLAACKNTLLVVAAQPLFAVLRTHLERATYSARFHRAIDHQHGTIAEAIAAGDADAAEVEMRSHLAYLRPYYEKAWRAGVRGR